MLVAARSLGGLVFSNGRYALSAATSAAAAASSGAAASRARAVALARHMSELAAVVAVALEAGAARCASRLLS